MKGIKIRITRFGVLIAAIAIGALLCAGSAQADSVSVSGTNFNSLEGVAFTGTVATFTDSNGTDAASAFTATTDWGDTITTSDTITGGSGSFGVSPPFGGHTYDEAGNFSAVTTVTRTADGVTFTATSSATVSEEGDVLSGTGTTFIATPNVRFSGTFATFTDSNSSDGAAFFAAITDWGDGTTSADTITGGGGSFSVSTDSIGHTYASGGVFTVTTTVTADDEDGDFQVLIASTADVGSVGVPEPGTLPLLLSGLALLGSAVWRRRSVSAGPAFE